MKLKPGKKNQAATGLDPRTLWWKTVKHTSYVAINLALAENSLTLWTLPDFVTQSATPVLLSFRPLASYSSTRISHLLKIQKRILWKTSNADDSFTSQLAAEAMLRDTGTFNFAPSIAILSAVLPMFTRDTPKMIMHVVSIYKLLAEKNLPDIYLSKRYNCIMARVGIL